MKFHLTMPRIVCACVRDGIDSLCICIHITILGFELWTNIFCTTDEEKYVVLGSVCPVGPFYMGPSHAWMGLVRTRCKLLKVRIHTIDHFHVVNFYALLFNITIFFQESKSAISKYCILLLQPEVRLGIGWICLYIDQRRAGSYWIRRRIQLYQRRHCFA